MSRTSTTPKSRKTNRIMLDPSIAKGLLVARREEIDRECEEEQEKRAFNMARLVMAAGALTGAGAGAIAGGPDNRIGGALQGAMIGLAPGFALKGVANTTKAFKEGLQKANPSGLNAEASAISKSGGPAAPTANNPTAGS